MEGIPGRGYCHRVEGQLEWKGTERGSRKRVTIRHEDFTSAEDTYSSLAEQLEALCENYWRETCYAPTSKMVGSLHGYARKRPWSHSDTHSPCRLVRLIAEYERFTVQYFPGFLSCILVSCSLVRSGSSPVIPSHSSIYLSDLPSPQGRLHKLPRVLSRVFITLKLDSNCSNTARFPLPIGS